ncbi:transmembrane protein 132D isoform X1 [Alosa sapidissima]|uniref:transmembrane protein 132D isoform X1 n=2 Tax=Alosa sapidissima TaxID=34773 RepID=UPI001C0836F7|nr:transmembrane protein 132D isoform X1 [Alosa sapidissima]
MRKVVKMAVFSCWMLLLTLTALAFPTCTQGMKVEELSDDPRTFLLLPVYPSVKYQILNAEPLFLRDAGRDLIGNASLLAQRQVFMLSNISSSQQQPPPSINASYGQMSVERAIPQELLQTGPRIRAFIMARQVRSSAPIMRVLFHSARSDRNDPQNDSAGESGPRVGKSGFICVMTYAFWETREVRGACSLPAEGGSCLARLKPEPTWFGLGSGRSSRENRGEGQANTVELYYQTRPSPTSQCSPQDGQTRRGQPTGLATALRYGVSGTRMKRIGSLKLLRSPPGNPTFMRVRLGGTVVIQTSSKPVKTTDTATFYVFLPSASPVERFILRTTVKKGLSFSVARPSDPGLWDIALEPSKAEDEPQTLYVVCQKKSTLSGKRGLLEVLQLDFEAEEFSDQLEGQLITWRLELPGNIKDEGSMTIYTTQKDFIGLAPLIMDTELLNTAVLTGKRVSIPVALLAVEADGSVTDITNSTSCQSADTDILKVSERCDFVYMDGKETGGRVQMLVNFTYSYLSAQLEVSVWMPRLPLHIELSDSELSQIKGWRVPVSAVSQRRSDSEEEEDRKGRGCMLQYQHARIRVLTPFLADGDDPTSGSVVNPPAYFLGPDWQVDVTRLVQGSMRVADASVARLQADTVLAGRSVGVTTVQVMSPLSDSVLAERMVRVLDDKVSITELGVQLVSGLSLNLQLSPGSNRAIVATATTQELMQSPKQEALISPWVQFSDGSLTSLDLFDPSGYTLSASSLDESVATVRQGPHPQLSAVAEGDGQGSLLRVELGICEACQKSKRKSKLAVGSGAVRVKLLPPDEEGGTEATGKTGSGTGRVAAGEPGGDAKLPEREVKQALTSPRAVPLDVYTQAVLRDSRVRELSTTSTLQEAMGEVAISTAQTIGSTTTVSMQGQGSGVRKEMGNLLMNSISHFGPEGPSQRDMFRKKVAEVPKEEEGGTPTEEPPAVESSDLIRAFGVAFSDLEICIYALVGVSCLAILGFLLNCATYGLRSHGKKTPVQTQDPREHRHHWVRLSTSSDPGRLPAPPPPAAATVARQACQGHPHPEPPQHHHHHHHQPMEAPPGNSMPPPPERTATLGRRSSTQPCWTDSVTSRSATLLAKPVRTEPLHSPTSKRNQVQFTTFTTLDIKHLAALKRNGMEVSWAAPVANYDEPKGGPLPDIPYPTAKPHIQG